MSVKVADRKLSSVQFVDTARELVVHTLTYAQKFPKKMMFLITKDIVDTARSIYKNVVIANSIYPKSKLDYEMRYKYFIQAKGLIEALDGYLSIAKDVFKNPIEDSKVNTYAFIHWGELLDMETKLIKGIIASDSQKYEALI